MKTIIYTLLFSILMVSCEKDYIYIKKIRLKLPKTANGLWPAFWMMGADYPSVGWPIYTMMKQI